MSSRKYKIPVYLVIERYLYEDEKYTDVKFHTLKKSEAEHELCEYVFELENLMGVQTRKIVDISSDDAYEIGDYKIWIEERFFEV